MNETNIGERIKKLRKQKGMSVEELAKRIGKNKATVYRYEKNEISDLPYTILIPIAEALHTTPAYLMGWDDESTKEYGKAIHKLRMKKNITIMEMAEELHISVEMLKEYEDGKRQIPMYMIERIASFLDVEVTQITSVHIEGEDENLDRVIFSKNQKVLKWYETWDKEVGVVDFSDEEMQKLMEYAKFLISQRKG